MNRGLKSLVPVRGLFAILMGILMAGMLVIGQAQPAKAMTPDEIVAAAAANITSVSATEAKPYFDSKVLFIDVREPSEYQAGHIPGAVNIPRGILEFNIAKLAADKSTPMVVYCASGKRSALATEALGKLGYTKAVNMTIGLPSWTAAGYPTEK